MSNETVTISKNQHELLKMVYRIATPYLCSVPKCETICLKPYQIGTSSTGVITCYVKDRLRCWGCSCYFCSNHAQKYRQILCYKCVKNYDSC